MSEWLKNSLLLLISLIGLVITFNNSRATHRTEPKPIRVYRDKGRDWVEVFNLGPSTAREVKLYVHIVKESRRENKDYRNIGFRLVEADEKDIKVNESYNFTAPDHLLLWMPFVVTCRTPIGFKKRTYWISSRLKFKKIGRYEYWKYKIAPQKMLQKANGVMDEREL